MFTADSYSVGGKSGPSITGIADTGTSLLLVDDSVVSAYWGQVVGSVNDATQGGYTFPCDGALPDFSVVISGATRTGKFYVPQPHAKLSRLTILPVPGSYMNYASVNSTTCFGGLQSNAGVGFSIFGDIFLKSQYVVFDMSQSSPRIGFGEQ
jgi:aspergillopepsin I